MTPPNPARAACGSVRTDDLPDRLRTVAALLHEAASDVEAAAKDVEAARRARDAAIQGREGQDRNTLAFMRERDALADRITRALAILDTAPDPVGVKLTRNEADAIQAANRQAHAVLSEGRDPLSKRRAEDRG